MRIFKNNWFNKFARKEKISDESLKHAVDGLAGGLTAVDLGGNVFKLRIARKGQGKSGGFRTIVAYRAGDRLFFIYGFAKNQRSNVSKSDLVMLKKLAKDFLEMTDSDLDKLLRRDGLKEIVEDEQ